MTMKEAGRKRGGRVLVVVTAKHHTTESRGHGRKRRRQDEHGRPAGEKNPRLRPKTRKRRTLNRSPHGNKTAREQFFLHEHGMVRGGRERTWSGLGPSTLDEARKRLRGKLKRSETVWKGAEVKLRRTGGSDQ